MHFSVFATALLSLAGITHAVDLNIQSCETDGPWVPAVFTGDDWSRAPDYQKFCEAGYTDGDVLTGIKIWRADWQIHALSLRWGSHDYGKIYGQPEDQNEPDATVEWDASSTVFIRMWNNKPDDGDPVDAVGKIRVEVEGKDGVEVAAKKVGDEIDFGTGSGMILAAEGAQGAWISNLRFFYLESKIVNAALTSMEFTDSIDKYNDEKKGIAPTIIGNIYIKNSNPEGGLNQTCSLSPKLEKQTSKSVTTTMTHTIGTSVGVKVSTDVGLPMLMSAEVEVSTEIRYDFSYMKAEESSETDIFSFTWTIGSTPQGIPPQHAMHCTATATMGTFDSDYRGKITVTLDNGKTFEYNDSGTYKSIGYADGVSDCQTIPLSEVPVGQGQEANGKLPGETKRAIQFIA